MYLVYLDANILITHENIQCPGTLFPVLIPQFQFWKNCTRGKSRDINNIVPRGKDKHVNIIVRFIAYFLSALYLPKIVDGYSVFPEIGGRSNLICLFDSASLKLSTHSIIDFICISSIDALHIMHICANKICSTIIYEVKHSKVLNKTKKKGGCN